MSVAAAPSGRHASRPRRRYWIIGGVLLLMVIARIGLAYAVQSYVNRTLAGLENYTGHVDSVSLHLLRGAYTLENLVIRKRQAPVAEPMFASAQVDIAVSWYTLIRGTVAAKIKTLRPSIHFAAGGEGRKAQTGTDQDWSQVIDKLIPIRIDQLDIDHGEIRYLDQYRNPPIDLHFTGVNARLTNLTNIPDGKGRRQATLHARATVMDNAPFELSLVTDPFEAKSAYSLKMEMRELDLHRLQPAMRAYLPFDAESGTLDLFVDAAGQGERYHGHVKPVFHHLELLKWRSDLEAGPADPLKLATKAVGSVLNLAFQNQRKQQLAADIPFEGVFGHTVIDVATTIGSVLQNAFVKALDPSFEHSKPDPQDGTDPKPGPQH